MSYAEGTNATVRQSTANKRYVKRQVWLYVLGAPSHFLTEYRHEAAVVSREHRMKSMSGYLGEIVINDHCHGSVGQRGTSRHYFPHA